MNFHSITVAESRNKKSYLDLAIGVMYKDLSQPYIDLVLCNTARGGERYLKMGHSSKAHQTSCLTLFNVSLFRDAIRFEIDQK